MYICIKVEQSYGFESIAILHVREGLWRQNGMDTPKQLKLLTDLLAVDKGQNLQKRTPILNKLQTQI